MLNLSIFDLLVPVFVLLLAILYLPVTLLLLLKDGKFSELSSWTSFEKAWFSRFWSFFGMASRALFAPDVEKVLSAAHGVVLDIGTGSGDWIYLFSEERNSNISKLYLVEPNTAFHPDLQKRVREYGLQEKCQIVRRTEDLKDYGVQHGSVDTISTVHVLCSVAAPDSLVRLLYSYLRHGGQWLVYEHVKASNKWSVAGAWQGKFILNSWSVKS
jgi:cyclopropane fatty-acyl-phospholipid synthase-like methyltransferase